MQTKRVKRGLGRGTAQIRDADRQRADLFRRGLKHQSPDTSAQRLDPWWRSRSRWIPLLDGEVYIWRRVNDRFESYPLPLDSFDDEPKSSQELAFGSDGRAAHYIASLDATAKLWDPVAYRSIRPRLQLKDVSGTIAVSAPDGAMLLIGCLDGKAQVWDARTGNKIGPSLFHSDGVVAAAFSPDATKVLTGSSDGTARPGSLGPESQSSPPTSRTGDSGSLQSRQPLRRYRVRRSHRTRFEEQPADWPSVHRSHIEDPSRFLAISPDGRYLVTGGDDNTARLWHVGQPIAGDPATISAWVSWLTGLALDARGVPRVLSAAEWEATHPTRSPSAEDRPARPKIPRAIQTGIVAKRPRARSTRIGSGRLAPGTNGPEIPQRCWTPIPPRYLESESRSRATRRGRVTR